LVPIHTKNTGYFEQYLVAMLIRPIELLTISFITHAEIPKPQLSKAHYYPKFAASILALVKSVGVRIPIPNRLRLICPPLFSLLVPDTTFTNPVEDGLSREFRKWQAPNCFSTSQKNTIFPPTGYGDWTNLIIILWVIIKLIDDGIMEFEECDIPGDTAKHLSRFHPRLFIAHSLELGNIPIRLEDAILALLYQRPPFNNLSLYDEITTLAEQQKWSKEHMYKDLYLLLFEEKRKRGRPVPATDDNDNDQQVTPSKRKPDPVLQILNTLPSLPNASIGYQDVAEFVETKLKRTPIPDDFNTITSGFQFEDDDAKYDFLGLATMVASSQQAALNGRKILRRLLQSHQVITSAVIANGTSLATFPFLLSFYSYLRSVHIRIELG
jgi:hypothetical protein